GRRATAGRDRPRARGATLAPPRRRADRPSRSVERASGGGASRPTGTRAPHRGRLRDARRRRDRAGGRDDRARRRRPEGRRGAPPGTGLSLSRLVAVTYECRKWKSIRVCAAAAGRDGLGTGLRPVPDSAERQVLELEPFVDPVRRALAADPRLLDAAERRHLGRDEPRVDPDDSVFEPFRDAPDAADV